jgi:hypothetical protein
MFGEYEDRLFLRRLIRDFSVNSKQDLVARYLSKPGEADRYGDVALQYLPTSVATALVDIIPILEDRREPGLTLSSELSPERMASDDIVYVGLLSSLGALREPVFARSRFRFGESYDQIIDQKTGRSFTSEAFLAAPGDEMYRDYGFAASFAGPNGNRITVISGTRDTALIGVADSLSDPDFLRRLSRETGGAHDFEALFEVKGQRQASLETHLLAQEPIDSAAIWTGEPTNRAPFPAE